jgi:hypothetical protein
VASAACEPGALAAWRALLDPNPRDAHLRAVPAPLLEGMSYLEARRRCRDLWPLGLLRPGGPGGKPEAVFNPPEAEVLRKGDLLLVLAAGAPPALAAAVAAAAVGDGGRAARDAQEAGADAARARLRRAREAPAAAPGGASSGKRGGAAGGELAAAAARGVADGEAPQEILVVGWPMAEVPLLLEGIASFSPPGSRVTILSPEDELLAHDHGPDPGRRPCWHARWESEAAAAKRAAAARPWWWWPSAVRRWRESAGPAPRVVRFVRAAPWDRGALEAAGIGTCDTLILLPPDPPGSPGGGAGAPGAPPPARGGAAGHQLHPSSSSRRRAAGGAGWWGAEDEGGELAGASPAHHALPSSTSSGAHGWAAQQPYGPSAAPAAPAAPPPQQPAVPPLAHDAHVLASLVQIQNALLASGRGAPPHVVTTVSSVTTAELGAAFFTALRRRAGLPSLADDPPSPPPRPAAPGAAGATVSGGPGSAGAKEAAAAGARAAQAPGALLDGAALDLIAPDEVVASLLAQLAQEPEFSRLVHGLLYDAEGCSLRVRPPASFGIAPGEQRRA